jgi:RND family efflux transporter MFP subunit
MTRSLSLTVVAFCTLSLFAAACRDSEPVEPARAETRKPAAVQIAPVTGRDEAVTLQATGSFEPDEASDVASEVSGRVVATPVDVGSFVKAGTVLVRLQGVDAGLKLDDARANLARMEAALKLAQSQDQLAQTTAQRYAALLATGDVSRTVADQARTQAETSQQTVNTARASLAQAKAQVALAEKAVADVIVAAPFDGYISARRVSAGEWVQPSTPVVTLLKIDPLRLQLTIPAVQAGQIVKGQLVEAAVDAYPGRTFTGQITALNPAITPESRSFLVEARIANHDALLKPGMFAVASIDQGRTARSLFVPRAAVIEDVNTNSWRVFVIAHGNRARLRVVQLAPRQSGDSIRILSGIQEGEQVAVSNLGQLYDTADVVVDSRSSTTTAPASSGRPHAKAR